MPELRPLQALPALDTAPLFPALHERLIVLLRSLDADDWDRPTVAGSWQVRDVAAHLLDGDLRVLSAHRDGHLPTPDGPVESYEDVVRLIGRLNAAGVAFGRRLSPRMLTDLLEATGRWTSEFVAGLDPDALALWPVAWAGETASDNRFDAAREYTERWHHQMQIRDAVGARGEQSVLLARELLEPLIETSVRVLPHAYRDVTAPDGTTVTLRVIDDASGDPCSVASLAWTLRREETRWALYRGAPDAPSAHVEASADTLWRLLFNALPEDRARSALQGSGAEELLLPLRRARSVMV